jgi:hypothetical protein
MHKLANGDFDANNFSDVFSAMDDILASFNEKSSATTAQWGEDLKSKHEQLKKDFKDGKFQWNDINV